MNRTCVVFWMALFLLFKGGPPEAQRTPRIDLAKLTEKDLAISTAARTNGSFDRPGGPSVHRRVRRVQ